MRAVDLAVRPRVARLAHALAKKPLAGTGGRCASSHDPTSPRRTARAALLMLAVAGAASGAGRRAQQPRAEAALKRACARAGLGEIGKTVSIVYAASPLKLLAEADVWGIRSRTCSREAQLKERETAVGMGDDRVLGDRRDVRSPPSHAQLSSEQWRRRSRERSSTRRRRSPRPWSLGQPGSSQRSPVQPASHRHLPLPGITVPAVAHRRRRVLARQARSPACTRTRLRPCTARIGRVQCSRAGSVRAHRPRQ